MELVIMLSIAYKIVSSITGTTLMCKEHINNMNLINFTQTMTILRFSNAQPVFLDITIIPPPVNAPL